MNRGRASSLPAVCPPRAPPSCASLCSRAVERPGPTRGPSATKTLVQRSNAGSRGRPRAPTKCWKRSCGSVGASRSRPCAAWLPTLAERHPPPRGSSPHWSASATNAPSNRASTRRGTTRTLPSASKRSRRSRTSNPCAPRWGSRATRLSTTWRSSAPPRSGRSSAGASGRRGGRRRTSPSANRSRRRSSGQSPCSPAAANFAWCRWMSRRRRRKRRSPPWARSATIRPRRSRSSCSNRAMLRPASIASGSGSGTRRRRSATRATTCRKP